MTEANDNAHTPAPWHVGKWTGTVRQPEGPDMAGEFWAVFAGSELLCIAGPANDPENLANAKIIAAAPWLLAFAKGVAKSTSPQVGEQDVFLLADVLNAEARSVLIAAVGRCNEDESPKETPRKEGNV